MNLPDYVKRAQFVVDYLTNAPKTYDKLNVLFGRKDFWDHPQYEIIKGISENNELFRRYYRAPFKKFYTINSAIKHLDNNILIHFTNLHLYAVIEDLPQFKEFIDNVTGNIETAVDLRQVLLVSDKQKIIFVCSDKEDDTATKIQRYCADVFDATTTTDVIDNMIQITIEDIIENYKDSMYKFNLFKDQLTDRELAKSLSILPTINKQDHVYIQPSINNILTSESLEQLIAVLKNIAPGTTIQQLNIGNNNNNTVYNNQPVNKTESARNWIDGNRPRNRELVNEYYKRYLVTHPDGLSRTKLNRLVLEFDIQKKKTPEGIRWIIN